MRAGRLLQVGEPIEVYEKPADLYVAEFIGKANFVKGNLKRIDDSCAVVQAGIKLCRGKQFRRSRKARPSDSCFAPRTSNSRKIGGWHCGHGVSGEVISAPRPSTLFNATWDCSSCSS